MKEGKGKCYRWNDIIGITVLRNIAKEQRLAFLQHALSDCEVKLLPTGDYSVVNEALAKERVFNLKDMSLIHWANGCMQLVPINELEDLVIYDH